MWGFDIETLGLLKTEPLPPITCVCLYDGTTSVRLLFYKVTPEVRRANTETLTRILDGADTIAGFNAPLFDLEYIRREFAVPPAQMTAWTRKCIDPFMCLKFIVRRTCKLNVLLERNGLPSKTGSGTEAIALALAGRFEELLDYCLMDAVLAHQVCALPEIRLTESLYGSLQGAGVWHIVSRRAPPPALRDVLLGDAGHDIHELYAHLDACGQVF